VKNKSTRHLHIYMDGGSRGNPGPSGIGVVLKDDSDNIVKEYYKNLGITTNNVAEYNAVIYGLQEALFLKAEKVDLYIDSQLVTQQLKGEFRVKNANIKPLFEQVMHLISGFKKVSINNIPREKNREADKLANKAMNLAGLL